ncbi:hypothetical protein ACJMK2_038515 [Sinanodonta woodiana]|uniref:TRIM56 n=1 Tax=Sinanodonta woodiana TaxID=1069815 RepID=A0ABD3W976_SINWO
MATGGGPVSFDSGQLNCPICLETFKCPRSLTCLHTFCDGCLKKYICELDQKGALKTGFPCPICRKDMLVCDGEERSSSWTEKFKVNRFIIDTISEDIENFDVDQMCGPCSVVEISSHAKKYCIECVEFLCDKCVRQHRRLKGTKSHILIQPDEMKSNTQFAFDQSDLQMCCKHPNKEVEFLCKDDNSLCCSICIAYEHKICTDIIDLNKTVGIKKADVQESLGTLSQLLIQIQAMVKTNKYRHDMVENQKQEISQKMKSLRDRINVKMDVFEKLVSDKSMAAKNETVMSILNQISRLQSHKAAIESSIFLLETICRNGNEKHVIIANYKIKDQIEHYSKSIKDEESKSVTVDMKFDLDKDFDRKLLMSSNLSHEYAIEDFGLPGKPKDFEISSPTIDHASGYSSSTPRYTSVCHLSDGRRVLFNCNNFTCDLFDDFFHMLTCVNINYEAHSIRTLGDNHIAISSYKQKCLELRKITDKFETGRKITTSTKYFGMDYIGSERFICATFYDPAREWRLTTMDTSLNDLSYITADRSGRTFEGAVYVKYDNVSSTVYQSSWKTNAVYSMSIDGTPKFTYTDLSFPRGLDVDRDGNIYICANNLHNIHQLSSTDGKLVRIISDVKLRNPVDISFHPFRDEFVVICDNTNANVLLFRFI